METNRVIAVTWPWKTKAPPALLLESLLLEAKRSGRFDPFVVDVPLLLGPRSRDFEGPREGLAKFVKTFSVGDIPVLSTDSFAGCLTDLAKKKQNRLLKGKDFFIITDGTESRSLAKLTQTLWVFTTPDVLTPSALYRTIGLYPAQDLTLYLWLLGVPSFEESARVFVKLREELLSLRKDYFTLVLAGALRMDPDRAEIAEAFQRPLIDTFPGDSLHGAIRFGLNRSDTRGEGGGPAPSIVELKKEFGTLIGQTVSPVE